MHQLKLILDSNDFKLIEKYVSEIHFFFIVSECNILEGETLKVSVIKSSAEKCVRCWHRHESVGSSTSHPELCVRCEQNLDGPGEDRSLLSIKKGYFIIFLLIAIDLVQNILLKNT